MQQQVVDTFCVLVAEIASVRKLEFPFGEIMRHELSCVSNGHFINVDKNFESDMILIEER